MSILLVGLLLANRPLSSVDQRSANAEGADRPLSSVDQRSANAEGADRPLSSLGRACGC